MTIAAICCRVSSEAQEQEGTSLDTQEQRCLDRATSLNWTVTKDFIIKEDWTGKGLLDFVVFYQPVDDGRSGQ
jgi:hypothetical protein